MNCHTSPTTGTLNVTANEESLIILGGQPSAGKVVLFKRLTEKRPVPRVQVEQTELALDHSVDAKIFVDMQ